MSNTSLSAFVLLLGLGSLSACSEPPSSNADGSASKADDDQGDEGMDTERAEESGDADPSAGDSGTTTGTTTSDSADPSTSDSGDPPTGTTSDATTADPTADNSADDSGSDEGGDTTPPGGLGDGIMEGSGSSDDRWEKADVVRNGANYFLMANGWGPGFVSQTISWNGTSFTIEQMEGSQGPRYEPASYPTVFCGVYSDSRSGECGLPAPIDSIQSLRTGWRWAPNGNDGEYNAAYDIWLGNGSDLASFSGFLMVWLREPPGQQPAGSPTEMGVTVEGVPGVWDIWTGMVNRSPIINWVRAEGDDSLELEFDVLDFIRDAQQRGLTVPGTHILSVAVGFEIWNGPITNLESTDFYVEVQ